jgi:5-methylcytosine-specific restriction endonuclease McrA
MRNYYRENPEQCEKRAERARNWWTPERRYKYHPSKTTPRPAAWNKGLTRSDPRVDANIRAASDTRRRRVFLTNAESLHLKELVRYGSDNNLWKGGVTPAEHKLLTSRKGREWSRYIIARFGFQCFCCNATVKLLAHHIFSRKHYPELAFHPDNGVSLCISCHRKLHGMAPKDKERLDAWRKRTLAPVGYAIPESLTTYLVT